MSRSMKLRVENLTGRPRNTRIYDPETGTELGGELVCTAITLTPQTSEAILTCLLPFNLVVDTTLTADDKALDVAIRDVQWRASRLTDDQIRELVEDALRRRREQSA